MDDVRRINDALEVLARGYRQPFFDLLSEDVCWEWSGLKTDLPPITGKHLVDQAYMFGGYEIPPHAGLGVNHVFDMEYDEPSVGAELTAHTCASGIEHSTRYFTWVFDLTDGLVAYVRAYMEPDD